MTTPDKLFRDQLADLPKTPPPNAWNRVSTGLQKTRQRRLGYRIAAIVLLFMLAGITIISLQQPTTTPAHQSKPAAETPMPGMAHTPFSQVDTNSIGDVHPADEPVTQPAAQNEKAVRKSKTVNGNNAIAITENQTTRTGQEISSAVAVHPGTQAEIIEQPQPVSPLTEDLAANITPVKIVYTTADVNARFRRKNEIQTDTVGKPSSGLQKVVALAYGFKNDNTVLGDLRHMKNELFSLPGKKADRVQ